MDLRAFLPALLFFVSATCLAEPPKAEQLPTTVEFVFSGDRLEKLRESFKDKKFQSNDLAAVFPPTKGSEYETVILEVGTTHTSGEPQVVSVKVLATTKNSAPKAKLITSLTPKDTDFDLILAVMKTDIAATTPKVEKIKKLIGKWELKEPGPCAKVVIEFTKDGEVSRTVSGTGPDVKGVGTFTVDGDKLNLTLKNVGEKEVRHVWTVAKLTESELTSKDENERELVFVRLKK